MPLALAMNEATESGIAYEDVAFVSYEFPVRCRSMITPGERFIYYRGRRRSTGVRQAQVYLGAGTIGAVRPSQFPGRLVCEVEGTPFATPVGCARLALHYPRTASRGRDATPRSERERRNARDT